MKNQNQKSSAKKENQSNAIAEKSNASAKSEILSLDIQKNIEEKLRDIPQGKILNSPSIYKIDQSEWDAMKDKDRKSFRRKMRSKLQRFSNNILAKDRSDEERINASKEFMQFFEENYIASDLNASAIYSGSDSLKRKEYEDMIFIIKSIIK